MKLFIVLGNQLFSPKYFADYKDHTFFMAEDYGLCTFEKHHKHKIILFLSSMRSFKEEIKSKNFKIIYKDINNDFNLFQQFNKASSIKYINRQLWTQTTDGGDNISFDDLNTDRRFL